MLGSQAGYYQDYARREARAAGLPEEFVVALFDTESNWNPQATSSANARGIAQFIPETGSRYGLKTEEDFYNPEKSMSAGVRHLKDLYDKYEGDLEKTAAAYNAGSGAVDRYGGMPPYKETRNYWNRIQRKMGGTDTSSVPPSLSRSASMNGQNPLNLDPSAIGLLMGQDVTLEPVASPEPTVAQRMATDPWLQMGLGILSARTGSGMGNIASGMQQGLLAAQQGELSSQKIRNQAVQNEQRRRQQQLLRQAQLQNAVRLMGGEAMNPWQQHQMEQALYGRQQDALIRRSRRYEPTLLKNKETGEKVTAVYDTMTSQYRRVTAAGPGEAIDVTKYEWVKPTAGKGGAEDAFNLPTAAEAGSLGAIAVSDQGLSRLIELAEDPEDPVDLSGLGGLWTEWLSKPEPLSVAARTVLPQGMNLTEEQTEAMSLVRQLENTLLEASRGAAVGPREQLMFRQQLPVPGSANYLQNLKLTQRNLRTLSNIRAIARGQKIPFPDAPTSMEEWRTANSGSASTPPRMSSTPSEQNSSTRAELMEFARRKWPDDPAKQARFLEYEMNRR